MNPTKPSESSPAELADPVPGFVREIVELFQGRLRQLKFGDIDGDRLMEMAESTREQARQAEAARARWDEASQDLEQTRQGLVKAAEQALAYAKVYATGDEELVTTLEALAPRARPGRAGEGKRRGRPKRSKSTPAPQNDASLSAASPAAAAENGAPAPDQEGESAPAASEAPASPAASAKAGGSAGAAAKERRPSDAAAERAAI